MEPWVQEAAMVRSVRPSPLDDRPSYQTWIGVFSTFMISPASLFTRPHQASLLTFHSFYTTDGQHYEYRHPGALFPERYAPNSTARPWHCPVLGCGASHHWPIELVGHFSVSTHILAYPYLRVCCLPFLLHQVWRLDVTLRT